MPDETAQAVQDDWEWRPMNVTCANCSAVNVIHEQRPEDLEVRHPVLGHKLGVKWECNHCSHVNTFGGEAPYPVADFVTECVECHHTFDPNRVQLGEAGSWKCPDCGTEQCHVHVGTTAGSATEVATS